MDERNGYRSQEQRDREDGEFIDKDLNVRVEAVLPNAVRGRRAGLGDASGGVRNRNDAQR